ncbi:MAG: discoidin domain-containing protein [Candidatus Aenigmatarchaeota archaeon]
MKTEKQILLIGLVLLVMVSPVFAENSTMHLFDKVNTTVLVNNTAIYDINAFVECNYVDPDDQQIVTRSQCELIQKNSKKQYISQLVLTKPGDWKIHSCVVYGSLQDNCENAVPQNIYNFQPMISISAAPKPNSVDIISPSNDDVIKGVRDISAVVTGDYEKLEFGYGASCDSAAKRLVSFSSIPVIFSWNTTAIADGKYKMCLFLSGYGYESKAVRSITIENYNFTLNPIGAFNQSVLAGKTTDYVFTIKNTGGVKDVFQLSTGVDALVGSWNAKIYADAEINQISLVPGEEKNLIIRLAVPFISLGSDALLKMSAVNSNNEKIEVSQRLVVSGRIQRAPEISDIVYPDPADQGFEASLFAKIQDPDQDAILSTKVCLDETCTKIICEMGYDVGQDLYTCNTEGLSALSIGDYRLLFIATDSTNTRAVKEVLLRIAKPESINILTPYLGEHLAGTIIVKADLYVRGSPVALFGIGTDASCAAVSYNQMKKDPSTSGTFVYSWNTELVEDGKYFVCVKAIENNQEKIGSRLVYVDNYRFELNPIYRSLTISKGSTIDLDYSLKNNGKKTSFEISTSLPSEYQLIGLTVAGRLVDKQTVIELNKGDRVNITAKIAAKSDGQADFIISVKSKDIIKSTTKLIPSETTNREPFIVNLNHNPDVVDTGSVLSITADSVGDRENDFISQKDVCKDIECNEKMCILAIDGNKLSCLYDVRESSGLHQYYTILRDNQNNMIVYMKEYSSRERIDEPVCGGTTSNGFFECRQYAECSDKEFPPPCYGATALGTDGCLRGKVCCKLDQKACTSTTGCNNRIVSKSCIYDSGTNAFSIFAGIDWYGGAWSDVFIGSKKSQRYDSYSYIDSESINQDGVIRITSNVYGIDNSLYCSNESYVYCYRSDKPIPLTGIVFMHPVEAGYVKGIVPVEIGLNGLGITSLAVSETKDCVNEKYEPMFCTGNVCKLNWDTTLLEDKGYYICAKAEADRIITKSIFVNVKNYDFAVNSFSSAGYVTANDIFQYPLFIKNTGGKSDTFIITISSDKWNVSLAKMLINLAPGESETVNIVSSVPNIAEYQSMVARAKIMSSKKSLETANGFVVRSNSNHAPYIRHVSEPDVVELGNEIQFNVLLSDKEGDSITAKVCKDNNCSQVYCNMNSDDNERYYCSYDTFDDYTGTHMFYIYASDSENHVITSEYVFNIKAAAPLITPVNITINRPSSTSKIKGIITAEVNAIGTDQIEFSYSKANKKCADGKWEKMQCTSGVCTLRIDTIALADDTYYFCAKYKSIIETVSPVFVKNFNFKIDPVFSTAGLQAGMVKQLGYNITNIGAVSDNYTIKIEANKNWDISIEPKKISLAENKNANILVRLDVPAGIMDETITLTIIATSQRTGTDAKSKSNLTVTDRSYSHPQVSVSASPMLAEEGSLITFSAMIADPEEDRIIEKNICLDEFCNKLLCILAETNGGYECDYVIDIPAGTYEYYAVVKDNTSMIVKTVEIFDVKKKKMIITDPYADMILPEPSSRAGDRLGIKFITATSYEAPNSEENLIDNIQRTYWATYETGPVITADLGDLKSIDSIGIYSLYGRPGAIKLALSSNCLDFYPLTTESNLMYAKNWYILSFQKKDVRCVELTIDSSELNITTMSEFEIYNAKAIYDDGYVPTIDTTDYTLVILIIVIAAIVATLIVLRHRLADAFREFSLWLKYR